MNAQATAKLTFDAWLAMPETKQPCEVIDGVMMLMAGPTVDRQWIVMTVHDGLKNFAHARQLGVVLFAPLDLVIRRDPLRTRQPDVMYLSAERTGIRGRADLSDIRVLEIPRTSLLKSSPQATPVVTSSTSSKTTGGWACWNAGSLARKQRPWKSSACLLKVSTPWQCTVLRTL